MAAVPLTKWLPWGQSAARRLASRNISKETWPGHNLDACAAAMGCHMSEGLVVVVSSRPFEDTLNALVASVKHGEVEIFGIVDHAVKAQSAGLLAARRW